MSDQTDNRVNIWSVKGEHRYLFSVSVFLLFLACLYMCWGEIKEDLGKKDFQGITETLLLIGAFSVTITFVLYEGVTFIMTLAAELFIKSRRVKFEKRGEDRQREEVLRMIDAGDSLETIRAALERKNGEEQ